jgi:hypothetical protein
MGSLLIRGAGSMHRAPDPSVLSVERPQIAKELPPLLVEAMIRTAEGINRGFVVQTLHLVCERSLHVQSDLTQKGSVPSTSRATRTLQNGDIPLGPIQKWSVSAERAVLLTDIESLAPTECLTPDRCHQGIVSLPSVECDMTEGKEAFGEAVLSSRDITKIRCALASAIPSIRSTFIDCGDRLYFKVLHSKGWGEETRQPGSRTTE